MEKRIFRIIKQRETVSIQIENIKRVLLQISRKMQNANPRVKAGKKLYFDNFSGQAKCLFKRQDFFLMIRMKKI